jgi:hypothetical protein
VSLAALYHPLRLPRRWRCSTCCRAAGSTGAPAAASPCRSSRRSACRRGKRRALPRGRRDRAAGDLAGALQLPRQAFPVRRHRAAAQAAAEAVAGVDGGDLGKRDRLGGRPRLLDPDGPARLDARSSAPSAALLPTRWPRPASPTRAATSRWPA